MATTTFLSNATINITQGATTYDLSAESNSCTVTVGVDQLEATSFGDAGRVYTAGLQSVEVAITMFLAYGGTGATSEVEAALAAMVGKSSNLTISPSGTTESASNPEYVIQGAFLQSFTPINSVVGELAQVDCVWAGGTWVRDVTAP
ncbi:hypothetical protein UFOVP445_5 [uncultured Caudovirales phage]|uniref:Uncharacterized protein n=1 Tax=uncultured Caudovirales phage TaxID=2100421 RepID=A0A6J5MEN0_9CAUD|nr:hypothetical protein UFOVP445_5 [uncultured Caudovirales phage]